MEQHDAQSREKCIEKPGKYSSCDMHGVCSDNNLRMKIRVSLKQLRFEYASREYKTRMDRCTY